MNISIGGLQTKGKGKALPTGPPKPKKTALHGDSEDEADEDVDFSAKLAAKSKANGSSKRPIAPTFVNATPTLSRAQRDRIAQAQQVDSSVYEYDEVFDAMKAGQRKAEAAREQDAKERKPRYIEGLIATAQQRKMDHVRAEDVMTARERQKEGSEFADKDAFVTPAYLAQQEALREAEEEEKRKEAQGVKKGGLASFYANYLDRNAQAHDAAVQAAAEAKSKPSSLANVHVYDEEPVADVILAKQAAQKLNKVVELNEDGQIVDKTELLTGGLNLSAKPKKTVQQGPAMPSEDGGFAVPISQRQSASTSTEQQSGYTEEPHHSGLSEAQRRRLQRERQSREIQQQLVEVQDKKRKAEEEELAKEVKKVARRNDESTVERLKREAAERRAKAKADAEKAAAAQLDAL